MKNMTNRLTTALAALVLSAGANSATLTMYHTIVSADSGAPNLEKTYIHNGPFTTSIEHSNPLGPYLESPMVLTGGGALSYGKFDPSSGYLGLAAVSQSKPNQFSQIIVGSDLSYTDEIDFEIPGATAATKTPVTVQFRVTGDVTISDSNPYAWAQVISNFGVGGIGIATATIESRCYQFSGCTSSVRAPYYDQYIPDAVFEPGLMGESGYDFFSIPLVLDGKNPTISWKAAVTAVAQAGIIDLRHTLGLSILAPEGVTFSSPSGFFVSDGSSVVPVPEPGPSPVPEPQPYALFAIGLAMICLSRQRTRIAELG